jgi:hypothetical protein
MTHTYNKGAARGSITIFRTIEGSVAKLAEDIKEEAEVQHPKACGLRPITDEEDVHAYLTLDQVRAQAKAMAITRGAVQRGDEMPVTPPETPTAKKRNNNNTEKQKFNPTESVPMKTSQRQRRKEANTEATN